MEFRLTDGYLDKIDFDIASVRRLSVKTRLMINKSCLNALIVD